MPVSAKISSEPRTVFSRLLPACAFLLALCFLVTALYGYGYGSLPPVEQRYSKTKNDLDRLRSGDSRSAQREHWLRVAKEFQEIYDLDPKWNNRPAALFRKAECLRELARRSGRQQDYQRAATTFEELAMRHAQSRLADDALLNSAEIRGNFMGDSAAALRLLARIRAQYAHGDMLPQARELERAITPQSASKEKPKETRKPGQTAAQTAPSRPASKKKTGELTRISWKTYNQDQVRIVVELDRSVSWQARQTRKKNAAARASLILEFQGALPSAQIRAGARVADSPLHAVRVDAPAKEQTRLFFDFANSVHYETRVEQEPFRIILDIIAQSDKTAGLAAGAPASRQGKNARSARDTGRLNAPVLSADAPKDLASQLALTVQNVFIDAGHGGKDPGAGHNGIVERDVALDVAGRVGKILRNHGLAVQHSREKNIHLSLNERTRMANKAKADLFISIHVNASTDAQAAGFETFYLDVASNTEAARLATMENAGSDMKLGDMTIILADFMLSARMQESRQLARILQNGVIARLGKQRYMVKDGGTRAAPLHVLINTGMPAVLVELGYASNREESRRLASAAYRQSLAEGIAEGILAYRSRLLRKQTVDIKTTERSS